MKNIVETNAEVINLWFAYFFYPRHLFFQSDSLCTTDAKQAMSQNKPRWSLPSIVVYVADMVHDIGDTLVVIWLFFAKLHLPAALFYAGCSALTIRTCHGESFQAQWEKQAILSRPRNAFGFIFTVAQFWMWLGSIRHYERMVFEAAS